MKTARRIALALALCSRVPLRTLVLQVWTSALVFTGLIVLPAPPKPTAARSGVRHSP